MILYMHKLNGSNRRRVCKVEADSFSRSKGHLPLESPWKYDFLHMMDGFQFSVVVDDDDDNNDLAPVPGKAGRMRFVGATFC